MRYAVVVEKAGNNYSAYAPDLPGCVASGSSVKEAEQEILEAIKFHISARRLRKKYATFIRWWNTKRYRSSAPTNNVLHLQIQLRFDF